MQLGFIGLGRMGNPMARNLSRSGHSIDVYDVVPAAIDRLADLPGFAAGDDIASIARAADVVFASLPGPADVEAAVAGPGGLLDHMRPGAVFVDLTTNAPAVVRDLSQRLAARGIAMLDAPVSGGVEGAEAATLSIMAGGNRDTFEQVRPLLEAIGSKAFYCGDSGAGCIVKLCNNIVSAATGVILGEALTLGVKAGVDLETLAGVIGQSTGSNVRLLNRFPRYLFRGDFTPGFSADLSAKDTRLALELAGQYDVPMAVGVLVGQELTEVLARGWGPLDFDTIVRLQEERTGVALRL